ncbi:Bifunctional dihydroflavonol 4-reductase/flavanone 4-reductase [Hordeum vulgare]|nr:Bifunctional dihydroflavonol 4-reductase/flavanone 4-reductase [Hordeum vulgare]
MDTRRLRRKNAKELRLSIEQSECGAKEEATETARLAKLRRQQDWDVPRLNGLVILSCSSNGDDHDASSDNSHDPPLAAGAYSCVATKSEKGWRGSDEDLLSSL